MARQYGIEYPERPLMAVLSDLLGIPHFTTSRGSTVRSDFLGAALSAMGGDPDGRNKDELIVACVEAATGRRFDDNLRSPGDTVTNDVLQLIIDSWTSRQGLGDAARAPEVPDAPVEVAFDPELVEDTRRRLLAERAAREGQDSFRTAVLTAYGQACAVTGTNAVSALEAAHITPYRGVETNIVPNGICLRADLHRLWDSGQLAIHESTGQVLLGEALRSSSYRDLHGSQPANMPRRVAERPAGTALAAHRRWCGFT